MNKEEATRTLVNVIKNLEDPKVITNSAYQNKILFDAVGYSEIECDKPQNNLSTEETRDFSGSGISHKDRAIMIYGICKGKHDDSLRKFTSSVTDANYIFADTETLLDNDASYNQGWITIVIKSDLTYFAIIGDNEIEKLKEHFKGEFEGYNKKAIEKLGIEKDLEVDYNHLLREEPTKFKSYFPHLSDGKKKDIIKDNWEYLQEGNVDRGSKIMITTDNRQLLEEVSRDMISQELANG